MHFASDNWAGAADEVSDALGNHAGGFYQAYGDAPEDKQLEARFAEIFETDLRVYFVGTGTAANALALTAVNRPGGFVFCHRYSHLIEDECGAPEYFTGGARLDPIPGSLGKMDPSKLEAAIERFDPNFVHHGQPMAVSVTQVTESGTAYSLDELRSITSIAKRHELPVHMDGARFASAVSHLQVSPAEVTWKSGVDLLSFGGTKNGCWCAEALIVFDSSIGESLPYLRKRAAQLFSKTRFITAQFSEYLKDDLWLRLAGHANSIATELAAGLDRHPAARLAWQTQSNEVFGILRREHADAMIESGASFYPWPMTDDVRESVSADEGLYRFVTSFASTSSHVDEFLSRLDSLAG